MTVTQARVAHRIILPDASAALPLLDEVLGAFAAEAALAEDQRHDLALLLEELLANAVMHGTGADDRDGGVGPIVIALRVSPAGLRIGWCDRGRPFDPLAFVPPAPATALTEARLGGAGIALVRRLVRAGHYRRRAGRNVLTLLLREHPR